MTVAIYNYSVCYVTLYGLGYFLPSYVFAHFCMVMTRLSFRLLFVFLCCSDFILNFISFSLPSELFLIEMLTAGTFAKFCQFYEFISF